jgi:hypothetical protein
MRDWIPALWTEHRAMPHGYATRGTTTSYFRFRHKTVGQDFQDFQDEQDLSYES